MGKGFLYGKKREKFGWEAALREFRWSFVVAAWPLWRWGWCSSFGLTPVCMCCATWWAGALTLYGGFNVLSFVFSQERAFTFELVIGVLTAAIGISPSSPRTPSGISSRWFWAWW